MEYQQILPNNRSAMTSTWVSQSKRRPFKPRAIREQSTAIDRYHICCPTIDEIKAPLVSLFARRAVRHGCFNPSSPPQKRTPGSCVLRCVPSCACSVCRVGRDTTPPSERERATCRRMREGRRRTRCVPQRSCGVSHHVCVCCVCVLYMVFGRVRGAGAFLHERRSLVAVCARVVGV